MAFPDDRDRALQRQAFNTLQIADDLIQWLGIHNPARKDSGVGIIRAGEEFDLLTLRRKAGSMYRSSKVPVAAAVYGPSQVGKSLFVGRVVEPQDPNFSPLGRDESAGPPAYYPHLSFTDDLNPSCGANEATAIVSRFTTKDRFDEEARTLKDYAVLVRGLSRGEWLRVLARGFYSECDAPDKERRWDDAKLEELFVSLAAKFPGESVDRQWRMDLLDAFIYLKRFDKRCDGDDAFFNGLLSRYPLSPAGYVELAATLCWSRWPAVSALFQRVNDFLERMRKDGRDGILVHWAAVRFVLDSQQKPVHESPHSRHFPKVAWSDIVDKQVDGWYVLDYQPNQGPPREQLTTMQSGMLEMVIPLLPDRLHPEWRDVLAQIDFLDVPGMKASGRGESDAIIADNEALEKSLEAQMSIVKRGKVFYLFDRYIEELQAQALLMLIRGGKLEVRGFLKGYVNKWGAARYGIAPQHEKTWSQHVRDQFPSLFLGMTGIDEEFEKTHPDVSLYQARLTEIVERTFPDVMKNFGGIDRPFTNVYPIRYPGTMDNKLAQRTSIGLEKWTKAEQAFLASPLVQRYVADASHKWTVAMRDDDGGVSLLATAFRQSISADRKQSELARGLDETHAQMLALARRWWIDPNTNQDREKRIALANEVLSWLTDEPQHIYRRVRVLQESLCFRGGDSRGGEVMMIADFADMHPPHRDNPLPLEERLPEAMQVFLRDWGTKLAPQRWHDYTSQHRDCGQWLDIDVFTSLTRYMVDYLTCADVFDRLCQNILRLVNLRVSNHADRRYARRKFVTLVLNDYFMNPGDSLAPLNGAAEQEQPAARHELQNGATAASQPEAQPSEIDNKKFGLMAAFVSRWRSRLPTVLAAGAGNKVNIPAGNDELIGILNEYAG